VPTLHMISHEHYAMHATQLFLTGQVYPILMSVKCTPFLRQKKYPFQIIVKCFLRGVVLMFWHDIV